MIRPGDIFTGDDTGEDYEVKDHIATGGMGVVHKVTRLSDGLNFVAKSPRDGAEINAKKIKNEYGILKKLENENVDNVCRAVEPGSFSTSGSEMPILVMEEAKGAIIGEVIKKQIAATDVREILLRIAKAMSEVHKCGYIHRDLATDNIFVDDVGGRNDVTVIDFGVAAVKDDCETFARTKSITHKGFFSPPEQYKNGGGIVSIGNDIFSLGATGYAMLVSSEQVKKDLANNISPPYNPGNHFFDKTIEDQHLFDVITKATNETRSNRFAIMDDMVAMLEGAPPSELFPRIIVDGQAYPLMLDKVKWFLGRNHPPFSEADILVNETSPGATHISRKQAYIERMGNEECIFKLHHQGVNDTRVAIVNNGHSVRWNKVGSQGFPLGAKHTMICFGYAETPPGKKDANGNPLQPGPYKVLEYFPPEPDT